MFSENITPPGNNFGDGRSRQISTLWEGHESKREAIPLSAFSHRSHSHYNSNLIDKDTPFQILCIQQILLRCKNTFAQLLSMPVWPLPPLPLLCHLSHALPLVFSFSSTFRCTFTFISLSSLSLIHLSVSSTLSLSS